MLYRLFFTDKDNRKLTLSGNKDIKDDPGSDVWVDTTTLFTHLLEGHITAAEKDIKKDSGNSQESVIASGIINIYFFDFLKQLTTFHTRGPNLSERNAARIRFCQLFFGKLWDVYSQKILSAYW